MISRGIGRSMAKESDSPVLLDTSVWVEHLRQGGEPRISTEVRRLIETGDACLTGMVRLELLRGARADSMDALRANLLLLHSLQTQEGHFDLAGELGHRLAQEGFTVPQPDLLIATVAIDHGIPLMFRDRHFDTIVEHSDLQTYAF